MTKEERAIEILGQGVGSQKRRLNIISTSVAAAGAIEFSADLLIAKARLSSLGIDLERLKKAATNGTTTATLWLEIETLRTSLENAERMLLGLESLMKERIRD